MTEAVERRGDAAASRSNLPAERTTLIGRERELTAVADLLAGDGRLVTITGAPGVGKTRLGYDVARRWQQQAPGRSAIRVTLAEAETAEAMVAAVGAELQLGPTSSEAEKAIVQIGRALDASGELLLVLDNFEQLVAVAEETLGCWLEQAPALRLLVTSRQALAIPGEQRFELATLGQAEAIELFVARARMVAPSFAADRQPEAIDALVERLDRLPLAIELAAPRSAIFSPKEILGRLDERLDLLELDGKQLDKRHVTLRGTIGWSWSLLDDDERRALCACAVCAGGFGVALLAAMLESDSLALRLVQSLREKSLMHDASAGGETRFELLQSVRDYAREKLAEADVERELRRRHASYFLERADAWAAAVRGPEAAEALGHLRRDADNLLAACRFCRDDDPPGSVRMALAASEALALAGPHGQHLALLDEAVAAAERHDPGGALATQALIRRGNALLVAGDRRAAAEDLEGAVADARAQGDAETEARAQHNLGLLRRDAGDFDQGRECLERAAALYKQIDDRAMLARTIGNFATLDRQAGRFEAARASYERALSLQRELGDRTAEARALAGLGHLEAAAGQTEDALRRYRTALPLLVDVGDRRTEGIVLGKMAVLTCESGDVDGALETLDRAVTCLVAVGDGLHAAVMRARRAAVLALAGRHQPAEADLTAAERQLADSDDPRLRASYHAAQACVWLAEARHDDSLDADAAARLRQRARRAARPMRADGGGAPREEYVHSASRLLELCLAQEKGEEREQAEPVTESPPVATYTEPAAAASQLRLATDGSWFELQGERTSLARTPVLARMLAVLGERRQSVPGEPLAPAELFAAVWPDEAAEGRVATNRLYVAVAKLRRRGLDGVLIRKGGGYLLHSAITCQLV